MNSVLTIISMISLRRLTVDKIHTSSRNTLELRSTIDSIIHVDN